MFPFSIFQNIVAISYMSDLKTEDSQVEES